MNEQKPNPVRKLTCAPQSLSDLPADTDLRLSTSEFRGSQWFSRGWTLQELLAPRKVVFFVDKRDGQNHDQSKEMSCSNEPISGLISDSPAKPTWFSIGEKTDLSDLVSSITGVDIDILIDPEALGTASIAQRMSWASRRVTSRPEDTAYCLMGLFDVNMPMLYGEGAEKAFLRLQEEIMKSSDDQSLFAWRDERALSWKRYGLLATSPRFFHGSNHIVPYQDWKSRPPYVMTNRGLQIELPLKQVSTEDKDRYLAVLDCPVPPDYEDHCFLAIILEKLQGSELQFARVLANYFYSESTPGEVRQIFVRQQQRSSNINGIFPRHVFQLRKAQFLRGTYKVVDLWTPEGAEVENTLATTGKTRQWLRAPMPQAFTIGKVPGAQVAGALLFERAEDGERLLVRLGSAGSTKVGFDAVRQRPKDRAFLEDKVYWDRPVGDVFTPLPSHTLIELEYHRIEVRFAEPRVHNGSKFIMVDLQIIATRFAERTASSSQNLPVLLNDKASAMNEGKTA